MLETLYLSFPHADAPPFSVSPLKPTIAGRSDACDLNLGHYFQDSLNAVGREHFKITYEDGQFAILDLGSINGTRLNGYPLSRNKARILRDGDKIEVAQDKDLTIVVKIERGSDITEPLLADPALTPILKPLRDLRDVVVLGVAGTGKTTLLRKLAYHPETQALPRQSLSEHHFLTFCYVNCLAVDDKKLASFFRLFIAATKPTFCVWPDRIRDAYNSLSKPDCSLEEIKLAVLETIRALHEHHEKRVVFLLDQFDDLYYELPDEVFIPLAEIKSIDLPVVLVIAMRNQLTEESPQARQFLRAMPARCDYWIPPFSEDKLKDVIGPYKLEPAKLQISLKFGGRQPRLTDLVAACASRLPAVPKDETELLGHLLMDRGIADHCREIWNSLLHEEQEALHSVVSGQPRMTLQVQTRLTQDKSLIKAEGGWFTVADPLFGAFVQALIHEAGPSQAARSLAFDEASSEFIVDGQRIPHEDLSKLERNLLLYLYGRANKVCTFIDISAEVWGYTDPELATSTEAIARVIHDLRQKLDQKSQGAGNRYIKNVRGLGYKCVIK